VNRFCKVTLVAGCVAICAAAVVVHTGFEFRPRPITQPTELYEVVNEQISAFQKADFPHAYQQVSSTFQERFNIAAFTELIRADYPDLLRAERIEFGGVRISERQAVVQVYFMLNNGDVVPCLYSLVQEGRIWKIDGAQIQKRRLGNRRLAGLRT
jgi:Domain of unknown function (DUF4864)